MTNRVKKLGSAEQSLVGSKTVSGVQTRANSFLRRVSNAPSPVTNRTRVAGSGTLAMALKLTPAAGQRPNVIEKLWPTRIPANLPPTPVKRIVVTPAVVDTLQDAKVWGALQLIAEAGTPDSMNLRLCHDVPELFAKNNVPEPPAGEVNVKCVPTLVHPSPQTGSLMMILGSGMPLANAAIHERAVTNVSSAAMRFIGTSRIAKDRLRRLRREQNLCGSKYLLGLLKVKNKSEMCAQFRECRRRSYQELRSSCRKMLASCRTLQSASQMR